MNTSISIEDKSKLPIDGDHFPHFTNIVIYLLHNALKHSKLTPDKLKVDITVSKESEIITIKMQNNIQFDEDYILHCKKRVEQTKRILDDITKAKPSLSKEGGTGFPKIKKALSQDLARNIVLINLDLIVLESEAWFKTEISFEYEGLQKKTNEPINN